jgi:hypothetical protein
MAAIYAGPVVNCDFCQSPNALYSCGRCYASYYCNRVCQVEHWKIHQFYCRVPPPIPELPSESAAVGATQLIAGVHILEATQISEGMQIPAAPQLPEGPKMSFDVRPAHESDAAATGGSAVNNEPPPLVKTVWIAPPTEA